MNKKFTHPDWFQMMYECLWTGKEQDKKKLWRMEPHGTGVWFGERKMETHFGFKNNVWLRKE